MMKIEGVIERLRLRWRIADCGDIGMHGFCCCEVGGSLVLKGCCLPLRDCNCD